MRRTRAFGQGQRFVASPAFTPGYHDLMTEWEQVVDAWQLESWGAYRVVARLGRKTWLKEPQRAILWSIFERVRTALKTRGLVNLLRCVPRGLLQSLSRAGYSRPVRRQLNGAVHSVLRRTPMTWPRRSKHVSCSWGTEPWGQRAGGLRSITINVKDPGRTGPLPLPPAGAGPNWPETMNNR